MFNLLQNANQPSGQEQSPRAKLPFLFKEGLGTVKGRNV
jgi:hypothetical protein